MFKHRILWTNIKVRLPWNQPRRPRSPCHPSSQRVPGRHLYHQHPVVTGTIRHSAFPWIFSPNVTSGQVFLLKWIVVTSKYPSVSFQGFFLSQHCKMYLKVVFDVRSPVVCAWPYQQFENVYGIIIISILLFLLFSSLCVFLNCNVPFFFCRYGD